MLGTFFQDHFTPPKMVSNNLGNAIMATNYDGTALVMYVNGELITYDYNKTWKKTSSLILVDRLLGSNPNYQLQMNTSGTYFFFIQYHPQAELKIQVWHRTSTHWRFHHNIKLLDVNIKFFCVSNSGNILVTNQYRDVVLFEYSGEHKKLLRAHHHGLEAQNASINEGENIVIFKIKSNIVLMRKKDHLFKKYENLKTEEDSHQIFIKNKLFVLTIYELCLYKVEEKAITKERCIPLGIFTKMPEQIAFAGSLVFLCQDQLVECYLLNDNWIKEENYFTQNFMVTQMVISRDAKRLFLLRKKYGCLMFERIFDLKQNKV